MGWAAGPTTLWGRSAPTWAVLGCVCVGSQGSVRCGAVSWEQQGRVGSGPPVTRSITVRVSHRKASTTRRLPSVSGGTGTPPRAWPSVTSWGLPGCLESRPGRPGTLFTGRSAFRAWVAAGYPTVHRRVGGKPGGSGGSVRFGWLAEPPMHLERPQSPPIPPTNAPCPGH